MEFRIADTFTESLARLTAEEQKQAKTTAFDLQVNPANPGHQFHRLNKPKDRNFWSVRAGSDIRVIVHRTPESLMLCYVDRHDAAYAWAERRVIERHPTTGAAQLVEVRETVREVEVPLFVPAAGGATARLFASFSDDELLGYGVPPEWLGDARAATEDSIFDLCDHLPGEAAEALLELATGGLARVPVRAPEGSDPFAHPDAQRRFRLMTNAEELERALDAPWEKWAVFLHPAQRDLVERHYNGPARVSGSAGTGKTVVALHRAAYLARTNPHARVLLTTFADPLARALRQKLDRLVGNEPAVFERITVSSIDRVGLRLYEQAHGPALPASPDVVQQLLREASSAGSPHRFTERFVETEWQDVVDAWQLDTWEAYRDVQRLGRKTRLPEAQRAVLWEIFARVRAALGERGLVTIPGVFAEATTIVAAATTPPFEFAVVDEAQDIGVPELRFLAALGGDRQDALFFAGDLGQRIFQTPFSWRSLGVDVRGRSSTLRINYRTSHQIRRRADLLLPPELSDVDENVEVRRGTISAFDGPEPEIVIADDAPAEQHAVASWLAARIAEGILPHEVAVFVRSDAELQRARAAVEQARQKAALLSDGGDAVVGAISVGTMHLAKGLEFRAVVVAACDDEVIPLQSRISAIADDTDLEDVYNTERHLLYVACTRARDRLLVTGVAPASEFLDDLGGPGRGPGDG